jgi:hypothetical protein
MTAHDSVPLHLLSAIDAGKPSQGAGTMNKQKSQQGRNPPRLEDAATSPPAGASNVHLTVA